jgi:integrase
MVELQLLAGMRPGETVVMRACDIDMSGKVWLYRPGSDRGPLGQHKTAHHGHQRVIALGPRAQAVIRAFLKVDMQASLFSPREAMEALWVGLRRQRKTKVQPSQVCRKGRKPKRCPGDRYSVSSYGKAIERGVEAANKAAACELCRELPADQRCPDCRSRAIPHWHPHQLRHTKATEIRREAGLDAARAVLGHRSPTITETYAEIDVNKAAEVMERLG